MGKLIVINSDKLEEIMKENNKELKKDIRSIFRKHMIATLTEIQSEIEEKASAEGDWKFAEGEKFCAKLIQQKIDQLKENKNESY